MRPAGVEALSALGNPFVHVSEQRFDTRLPDLVVSQDRFSLRVRLPA
jgi:hypothetical protein